MNRTSNQNIRYRPWLWRHRVLSKITRPIPFGLWAMNILCQRVLGMNSEIPWMVNFTSRISGDISIGDNVWKSFAISGGCYIQGINGVEIGDDTVFAPGVKIISANHDPTDLGMPVRGTPVIIGKRCWLGANSIVLPGIKVGDDVIVGAGAVVTKDVPSGETVAGVPAKPLEKSIRNLD